MFIQVYSFFEPSKLNHINPIKGDPLTYSSGLHWKSQSFTKAKTPAGASDDKDRSNEKAFCDVSCRVQRSECESTKNRCPTPKLQDRGSRVFDALLGCYQRFHRVQGPVERTDTCQTHWPDLGSTWRPEQHIGLYHPNKLPQITGEKDKNIQGESLSDFSPC